LEEAEVSDTDIIAAVEQALSELLKVVERIHARVGLARGRIDALVHELAQILDPGTATRATVGSEFVDALPEDELAALFARWEEDNCQLFREKYGEDWRARLEVNAQRAYGTDWKRVIMRNAAKRK
jgi:hypothetical protein